MLDGMMANHSLQDDTTDCNLVHSFNHSEQCQFVNQTPSCHITDGIFDYTIFIYCSFSPQLIPLSTTILIVWLLFLFIALAICADNFFCPSLVVIAKTLRMSDNIAGVTLLAFGNGSPDVFSAISAVQNMKNGDVGLVLGALLGAGVFLTTVVVGAVCMTGSFHAMERPFLRDLIFYIVTVFLTFIVCNDGVITLAEAAGYLIGYLSYVIIVIVGRLIYQYQKQRSETLLVTQHNSGGDEGSSSERDGLNNYANRVQNYEAVNEVTTEDGVELIVISGGYEPPSSSVKEFLFAISPIDVNEWRNSALLLRVYAVFKAPALFVIKLSVPVVDYTAVRHNWCKYLSVLHCIITPVFSAFAANSDFALQPLGNSNFLVCYIWLIVGCILAIIVSFTSKREQPPIYHWVFSYAGFVAAILWISKIANEIVNLLQTGGVVFQISITVLGLTFLAWGNSIPDLISDVAMAKRGFPRAGLSACFGGPLFNTLLGIGIPFTFKIAKENELVKFAFTAVQKILFVGLAVSLVSTLFIVTLLLRFRLNRFYGFYLFLLYAVFLIISILIGVGTIRW